MNGVGSRTRTQTPLAQGTTGNTTKAAAFFRRGPGRSPSSDLSLSSSSSIPHIATSTPSSSSRMASPAASPAPLFTKPVTLPRLQTQTNSQSQSMQRPGYTAPGATSVNANANPNGSFGGNLGLSQSHGQGYHLTDPGPSPRSGGPSTAESSSTSWGLGSEPPVSPITTVGTSLPSAVPAWGSPKLQHRRQQSSSDLDNMMANMGLNRFAPQASDRGAPGANGNGDEYMRLEELHDSDDAAYSPVFSPPRYPGYAPLPDGGEVPLSAVTAESASDDHFSPVPSMISRRRERPRYDEEDGMKIGARALASPPPHERAAHSHSRHAHAPTEESHDSVFSGSSGATGATGLMDTRPQLSSSTSTIVTAVTAVTTPPMGTDDMLMTLLAGQALVDCRELSSATATWEDIDLWKKELRLLSARVEDAQTRYQREERILTAARSLQKLNQTNKRLSRQTIASMEDAEKRVERARKDMLELRDREANIRRKLYEHWASALVWEVQRLERAHTETQSSLQMDVQAAESDRNNLIDQIAAMDRGEPLPPKMMDTTELTVSQTRERSLQARLVDVESELEAERDLSSSRVKAHEVERSHDKERINELEEMVVELQKSERSWEAGAKTHDTKLRQLERERAAWLKEKTAHSQQLAALEAQLATYSGSRDVWETEKRSLVAERDTLHTERSTFDNQMREHGARSLVWVAEREGLTNERDQLAIERDRLASERDRLAAEKDVLHQAHASLEAKHAALGAKHTTDRGTWQAERERLEAVSSQQVGSRDAWQRERETLVAQNERLETDLDALAHEHDGLKKELRDMEMVRAERTALSAERDALADELLHVQDQYERARSDADAAASKSKSTLERLGATLGSVLGRSIATPELVPALDEVRVLLDRRAAELETIQARHADELQTLTQEIDVLRAKDEQGRAGSRSAQTEMTELVRKIRTQNEVIAAHEAHIAELEGRGSGLSSSRSGAGATGAGPGDRVLETKLQRLWSDLPSPKARAEAGFSHNKGITSPSTVIDFGSLHRAYEGSNDKYTNVDDLMSRVRDLVEDGRLMVDRMKRMDADNRRHKNNAELASKLVTESAAGLSKYKEQVAQFEKDIKTLQDQMASLQGRNANGARSHVELTAKITSLHTQLEQAHAENVRMREAEDAAVAQVETLSTMLATAQDHEKQTSLRLRGERDTLSRDVAELKQKLNVNSMEMMDLQNEYHDLRAENKALLAKQAR